MRYSTELAARATAWLARDGQATGPEGKRSPEGLLELARVWAAIQQVPLPACLRQCQYVERARDVAAYVREFSHLSLSAAAMSDPTQAPSKYQLAPAYANQSFVHEDYNGTVTADNLTDEAAEFFIGKGRGDAFVKRDASSAASSETPADGSATATAPTNQSEPDAKLSAEQQAHAVTKQALHDEKEHGKAALKSEKDAHKATKKELAEAQRQLADAQRQLAELTDKAQQASEQADTDK